MTIEELKTTPTVQLSYLITEAAENNNQNLVNIYAYELASRIYVPNQAGVTFEKLLTDFGYSVESEVEEKGQKQIKKLTLK